MSIEKAYGWVNFIMFLQPLIEWLIGIVERVVNKPKSGEEKKEIVTNIVKAQFPIESEDFENALSEMIDSSVSRKNDNGEFPILRDF